MIVNRLSGLSRRKLPDGAFMFSNNEKQGNNRSFALTDEVARGVGQRLRCRSTAWICPADFAQSQVDCDRASEVTYLLLAGPKHPWHHEAIPPRWHTDLRSFAPLGVLRYLGAMDDSYFKHSTVTQTYPTRSAVLPWCGGGVTLERWPW